MRIRFGLLAAATLLAGCSASPTAPAKADGAAYESPYVGPGSTGDQSP